MSDSLKHFNPKYFTVLEVLDGKKDSVSVYIVTDNSVDYFIENYKTQYSGNKKDPKCIGIWRIKKMKK